MDMPRISPDGTKIAITSYDGPNTDLWLLEMERNIFTRLTSHPGEDFGAVWSPDGKQLAFSTEIAQEGEEGPGIAFLDIGSTDPPKRYLSSPGFFYLEFPLSWSPDGKWLLFASTFGEPLRNLEVMNTSKYNRDSLLVTPNSEHGGMFSPNGKWIAYVSDYSGREEVYIRPFLAEGNGKQVSVQGGTEPVWSPDGKEIFYRDYDKLMAVSVKNSTPLTLSPPKMLFEGSFKTMDYGGGQANYDIAPDGSRFVMINQTSRYRPRVIDVILNWDKI
jgi:Tol biopolymer transport system component